MPGVSSLDTACGSCKKNRSAAGIDRAGVLSGLFLAFLPKCPFCFMAFSGTMALCGNGTGLASRTFSSSATLWISAGICLLVLVSIALNFRDSRTWYALLLSGLGTALILLSVMVGGGYPVYYGGVFLVFMGVWLNASLFYFLRRFRQLFWN